MKAAGALGTCSPFLGCCVGVRLFLDLDGVLADFDRGVIGLTGRLSARADGPGDVALKWRALPISSPLWPSPATDGGSGIFCRPLNPTIRYRPATRGGSAPQKRRWVAEMLGAEVPIITCMSREKARYAAPGHVLVDDRDTAREPGRRPAASSSTTAMPGTRSPRCKRWRSCRSRRAIAIVGPAKPALPPQF